MMNFQKTRRWFERLLDRFVMWGYSKKHPCYIGHGEYDHDWEYHSDWYGDPDVIGGTVDCSHWECSTCGLIDDELDPPHDDFFDY